MLLCVKSGADNGPLAHSLSRALTVTEHDRGRRLGLFKAPVCRRVVTVCSAVARKEAKKGGKTAAEASRLLTAAKAHFSSGGCSSNKKKEKKRVFYLKKN